MVCVCVFGPVIKYIQWGEVGCGYLRILEIYMKFRLHPATWFLWPPASKSPLSDHSNLPLCPMQCSVRLSVGWVVWGKDKRLKLKYSFNKYSFNIWWNCITLPYDGGWLFLLVCTDSKSKWTSASWRQKSSACEPRRSSGKLRCGNSRSNWSYIGRSTCGTLSILWTIVAWQLPNLKVCNPKHFCKQSWNSVIWERQLYPQVWVL